MNIPRQRFNDKEYYYLKHLVFQRLSSFHDKEVTEESRDLYWLLNKLVNKKKGRPSSEEITKEKINALLIDCNHLDLGYEQARQIENQN